MSEFSFVSAHGERLFVRVWEAASAPPRGLVVIAHGYGEHGGRYGDVAAALNRHGFLVLALDHHGHGRSEGPRARIDFRRAVADLEQLLAEQRTIHPGLATFVLGHSMGGAIALRHAIAHPDSLRGLVLTAPMTRVDANPVTALLGTVLARVAPGATVATLDPELVSRDPAVVAAYRSDPLVHHDGVPAASAATFVAHGRTVFTDAARLTVPTLLMWGEEDGLAPPAGQRRLAESIRGADLTVRSHPGLHHEILFEPEGPAIVEFVAEWFERRLAGGA